MSASVSQYTSRAVGPGMLAFVALSGCQLSLDLDRYDFVGRSDAGQEIDPLSPPNGSAGSNGAGGASSNADASSESPSGEAGACPSCQLPHAEARCTSDGCSVAQCIGPWRDANGVSDDGCETGDIPQPGLTLWLMGDRGVTQSGGLVSAWQDQSPHRYVAAQGSPSAMPSLLERQGPPMLEFDGTADALALPAGFSRFDGTAFFAVVEALPNELCAGLLHFSNGPDRDDVEFGRHRPNRLYYEVLGQFIEGAPQAFETERRFVISVAQADDDPATGDEPESGRVELRINGLLSGAGVIPLPMAIERAQNYVGRNVYTLNPDECTMFFRGRIGELIFYPRELFSTERELVERYLREKWLP